MSPKSLGDEMYQRIYFQVQEVLDVALGTEEEHGAGAGLVAEVMLLAQRYEELTTVVNSAVLDQVEDPDNAERLVAKFEKRMAGSSGSSSGATT
jgi:hypothetical protein